METAKEVKANVVSKLKALGFNDAEIADITGYDPYPLEELS